MTKVRTRFAPSPTGLLHVGNVRTALINWLFARKMNGEFLLRIDDTDLTRSKAEYTEAIKQDLNWLGLNWDQLEHQSNRFARYTEVKNMLIEQKLLYPCFETPEELDLKRKIQLGQGKPPIYDRAALTLTKEQIENYIAQGKQPHYRFKLADKKMQWNDLVRGEVCFDERSMSDPILVREDGSWTYMLCSVIDDIDMNISHIIRGEDHISNTAVQLQMFEVLGAKPPIFAHLARITAKDAKISKRLGGFDIKSLREEKFLEPMSINNFLATIGTSDPVTCFTKINELVPPFEITKWHKSPTNYDEDDLVKINHKILANTNYADILPRLTKLQLNLVSQEFWEIVSKNLQTLEDLRLWQTIFSEDFKPVVTDADFLAQAKKLLPDDNWDNNIWSRWTKAITEATDRKGKSLFMPLRLALTGIEHGPELKDVVYLLGIDKIKQRLG